MDDKEIQALLFDAIQHDNDTFLDDLLASEQGKSLLDIPDHEGNMLLHVAVLDNRPACVDCLLKHGANPNVFDTNRARTPLHLAIELGHEDIVRKFLALENINLSLHDDRNLTCYEIAQLCDNLELAELIKDRHDGINQLKDDFYSIINQACSDNDPALLRELLDGQLNSIMERLKQHGHTNKDHVLFAKSRIKDLINWSSSSRNDVTLLFKSASRGLTKICEVLIDYGATAKCNENTNYSPLYVAAYSGYTDTLKLLLDSFPSLVTEVTIEKWTILHACCLQGHSETASLILNYPYPNELKRSFVNSSQTYEYNFAFDLNAQDAAGQTVIYLAVSSNNEKLLDTLLQFNVEAKFIGQSSNQSDTNEFNFNKDKTILDIKAQIIPDRPKVILDSHDSLSSDKSNKQIYKIIRQLQNPDNDSSHETTTAKQHSPTKKYLVCPFDLNTYCDYNSKTALHLAISREYHKIATALLVNGSDPNLPILSKNSNDCNDDNKENSSNTHASISSQGTNESLEWPQVYRSTCLKEACRANDDLMCDILIRYGAKDVNNSALEVAAGNNNDLLISKLLALNSYIDHEYKINKKCNVEFAARYKQSQNKSCNSLVGDITTFSSMFPGSPVIIDWHNLKYIKKISPRWLIEASLMHNKRLKHPTTSLLAITRLDLSSNGLKAVHPVIFRLPSLRELNLSKNRIESLLDYTHRQSTDGNSLPTIKLIESHRVAMKRSKSANLSSINLETSNIIDLDEPQEWDLPYLEVLDLHDNLLMSLPDCLFMLPRLKELDVSSNQIRQLPSSIWTAPSLKELTASNNLLDDLPKIITPDKVLNSSDGYSQVQDGINDHNERTNYPTNRNSSISGSLKGRESGIIYEKDYDRSFLLDLDDYTEYQLDSNSLDMVQPNHWKQQIEIVTEEANMDNTGDRKMESMSKISSMNLSHNSFTFIPSILACVTPDLTRLNLSHNRLQTISEVFLYPCQLKTLDLSHNQITGWFVSDLPDEVKRVCHARKLPIDRTIDCCHKSHQKFENLKSLNISHNMLTKFCLSSFTRTEDGRRMSMSPSLDETKSRKTEILAYPKVTALDLSFNKINQIPKQIFKLKDLSVLNLSGNCYITTLPPELGLATKLWNLGLNGCCLGEPLKSIIEGKNYKTMDVIGYLRSILEESKPYARLKLMLVGLQGIGKTSLLEQLRQEGSSGVLRRKLPEHWTKRMGHATRSNMKNQRGVTLSTVGVDIHDWSYIKKTGRNEQNFGPVSFSTWDFGGQEEFYATHRYFLSKRSLYLVVWKITDGITGILGIQQWLVNIESRASGSAVIIVGTHADLLEDGENGQTIARLQSEIHKRFIDVSDHDKCGLPCVMASMIVSTKTKYNIRQLCDRIYDIAFSLKCPRSTERLLEQKIPATYLYLEEIVVAIAHDRHQKRLEPVLTYGEYRKQATELLKSRYNKTFRDLEPINSRDLNYNSEFQQANRFLHENGVLLHYEDANLSDLYFLDPQWLCDILSHVVTIREINPHIKNGLMKIDDLAFLFRSMNMNMNGGVKSYVVNLLNKFEVGLTWNSQYLLIPSLLPNDANSIGISQDDQIQVRVAPRARGRSAVRKYDLSGASKRSASIEPSGKRNSIINQPEMLDNIKLEIETQQMQTIYRLVLLRYLPDGFFARFQSGILSDVKFEDICSDIQMYLLNQISSEVNNSDGLDRIGGRAGWTCWKTGIRLSLQRVSTINSPSKPDELINHLLTIEELRTNSKTSPILGQNFMVECVQATSMTDHIASIDGKSTSKPIDLIQSKWSNLNINEYSNILVISVPSWRLKISKENSGLKQFIELDKQIRAQLLALAVDHIDNLLEDWYPSLGTRFAHTLGGNYLVTRIAPCINCYNATKNFYDSSNWSKRQSRSSRSSRMLANNMINPFSTMSTHLDNIRDKQLNNIHCYYVEKCILVAYNIDATESDDADSYHANTKHSRNNIMINSGASRFTPKKLSTKSCENLHCPKHGTINLKTIAPDIVFDDVAKELKIDGDRIDRCRLIGRGTFGSVFKGLYNCTQQQGNRYIKTDTGVALKVLQPVDPGPEADHADLVAFKLIRSNWLREPFECVCRSYCTARHEINILQSVSHPNLVHFIGLSLKPLAIILELAPLGSLGDIFKNYKRSAMRIDPGSAYKTILQIAKALEFLHQQRIIYRDLKAENVLVWSFPSPFATNLTQASVEVKLADYGISRQALSSGIWKGFAGTMNFLAPEILRHNGDEEYTEKVDCFSFGMFMYELLTLKSPFKQNEAIRNHLAEGAKPTLTTRDMIYPSYMLDLMSSCWCYEPHMRPTSSQIVSIVSTPEFMQLYDVVSLNCQDNLDHVTFKQAIQYNGNNQQPGATSLDLWLGRDNFKTEIISSDLIRWINYQQLTNLEITNDLSLHKERSNQMDYKLMATAMCLVGGRIWICDTNLNMHVMPLIPRSLVNADKTQLVQHPLVSDTVDLYSGINRVQTFSLDTSSCKLDVFSSRGSYVEQMFEVESANCLILLMNDKPLTGRLYILDLNSMKLRRLDDNCLKVNCIAVKDVTTDEGNNSDTGTFNIYCGHSNGMSCMEIRDQSVFRQKILNLNEKSVDLTGEQVLDPSQSAEITSIVVHRDLVWTAAGCTIHLWSLKDQCVARKLDSWKLVPCSESLESINIEEYYEKSRSSRVSSMVYANDQLFAGTDHGCFVVIEGATLKPVIVFRPYESNLIIIKPLMVNTDRLMTKNSMNMHTESPNCPNDATSENSDTFSSSTCSEYLITIGNGYRDLLKRYVSSLNDQSTNENHITENQYIKKRQVAILWSANYRYQE